MEYLKISITMTKEKEHLSAYFLKLGIHELQLSSPGYFYYGPGIFLQ